MHNVRLAVRLVSVAFVFALCLLAREARAQTFCFPNAIGVPGQPGPPAWWTSPQPIDDPRWQGALGNATGLGDQAEFRALTYNDGSKNHIVLSLQVKADPGAAMAGDIIYFGLSDGTASGVSHVIGLVRGGASSTPAEGSVPPAADVFIRYRTGSGWIATVSKPAWLTTDTRINQTCSGVPPVCDTWTYRLRVPIDTTATADNPVNGVNIPAAGFKSWYEIKVASFDASNNPYVTRHKWPPTAPDVSGVPENFPDPTTAEWNAAKVGTGGACAAGVSVIASQVEVTNSGTSSGHEISVVNPNTFHARPTNGMAIGLGDNVVESRFRIANWGSAVGDSPSWETIPAPSVNCNAGTGPGTTTIATGAQFDLTCTWTLTDLQKCTYRPDLYNSSNTPACATMPPSKYHHQCILAELSMASGSPTPIFFSRRSAWRNMEFVNASRFEQIAEIDVRGLPSTPAPQRDVYIYVKAQNMPGKLDPDDGKDAATSPQDAAGNPNDRKQGRAMPPLKKGRVGTKDAAVLQRLLSAGQVTLDQIAEVMPTQTIYVWYDTGKKDGPAKILEPMPAFGYFVAHDGTLTGWDQSVAGVGATLTQIGTNFYRLGVAHNGSAKVSSVIVAKDDSAPVPTPVPPRPPWFWIVVGLGLLLILILLLLLRPKP